ncbi:hypothetical protein CERZMDRAFT_105130 [Cercospora zeae-maydis SCOH1-5]|uniref:Uncharacterized protein n=1 Tax=Cercospora zeae-maydis SCOH1-5 TaxID=717836 RepID=A0A6A6FPV7_9PEZI|nr:hypothetical protein CERZMDRAFT_105130 [Cercospora zeae-maydis SCOH1-5]
MSHLKYFSYPGWGERANESSHMSQAVRVGDFITISGQGGWNCDSGEISDDITTEIEQAFDNVNVALKDAGGKGWCEVFRINLYMMNITEESMAGLKRAMEKWMPDHKPVLTGVGVPALAAPGMTCEVEVWAHVQQ